MKVLVAEDDVNIRNGISEALDREGYTVVGVGDGTAALAAVRTHAPDFICLDIMMPGMSGYDVCREVRRTNRDVPIIFLSAKTEEIDKVLGLELGADDYIMKPFGLKEFVARVRAVCRRCLAAASRGQDEPRLVLGDLTVHPARLRAERAGVEVDLSLREVKLLQLFHDNPGKVLDRDALFRHGWGVDHYPNSRTLDQHISTLRKKVEADPKNPVLIRTVHGVGYRYEG